MNIYRCLYPWVCISARITVSIIAYIIAASDNLVLKIASAFITFFVGLDFMYRFWTHPTRSACFQRPTWWHDLRLFHSLLWWNVAFLFVAAGWITDTDLVASSIAPLINILINLDWVAGLSFKWVNRY